MWHADGLSSPHSLHPDFPDEQLSDSQQSLGAGQEVHSPLLQEPVTAQPLSVTVSSPASKKAKFERHVGAVKGLNPLAEPGSFWLNEESV